MSGHEKVLFSSEEPKSLDEIGQFLILLGQKLRDQGFITLTRGEERVSVRPEGATKLEIKYEIEGEKHGLEVEIEWKPSADRGNVVIS